MSELKPCPFHTCDEFGTCGCYDILQMSDKDWNRRPIEDALNKRIAELEALANVSEGLYERIYEQAARIADLEARAEKAEAMVEKLIEAGRMMKQPETIEEFHRGRRDYNALVAKWKEQK